MRYRYSDIFQISGGMVSPKAPIQLGSIFMGTGAAFGPGAFFGGIEIAAMQGHDIEADFLNGTYNIKGFY